MSSHPLAARIRGSHERRHPISQNRPAGPRDLNLGRFAPESNCQFWKDHCAGQRDYRACPPIEHAGLAAHRAFFGGTRCGSRGLTVCSSMEPGVGLAGTQCVLRWNTVRLAGTRVFFEGTGCGIRGYTVCSSKDTVRASRAHGCSPKDTVRASRAHGCSPKDTVRASRVHGVFFEGHGAGLAGTRVFFEGHRAGQAGYG
jgi:hypothetical protein